MARRLHHNGFGTVAGDTDLAAGNIKSGVEIFGTTGILIEATGDAAASQVLTGQTFSNSSATGLTGTMPDNDAVNLTPGTTAKVIAAGYHSGLGTVAGDTDLVSGNIKSGVEIFGTTGTVIEAAGDAATDEVLVGRIFSKAGAAGLSGTMPDNGTVNLIPGTTSQTIAQGYHSGFGTLAGDPDLTSNNIKSGVDIFGIAGDPNVVDTASGDAVAADILISKKAWVDGSEISGSAYPASVSKTGLTTSYSTGDDGDLEKGVNWPNPRFTDNGDGTVTDNLTGLIWLKNVFCLGPSNWFNALINANGLASGSCGLSDGSSAGDWRVPNIKEIRSLFDYRYYNPALSNAAGTARWTEGDAFSAVTAVNGYYFSSTSSSDNSGYVWAVYFKSGEDVFKTKGSLHYMWPVRDGQ